MANLSDKIGPSGVLTDITGESIKSLSDVYGSMSPTDGQALIYDTTNGWQSETLESGGAAPVDTQTFTTSGTWTKPASGSFAIIEVWGGGGSGTKSSVGCGGGGGGYNVLQIDLSSLGSTETVTIGAGGASQTTANTSGNNGGNTTFGSHLTGYGGGGGTYNSTLGGGGGGMRGAAQNGYYGGAGYSEQPTTTTSDTFGNTHIHITAGATGIYTSSGNPPGRFSYYGGGSGATGTNASYGGSGGGSYYGGAGGGSHGTTPGSGGVSRFGGNGGDGDGSAGSQPGGGGGGSNFTVDSGAGGDGMCVVKVYA